MDTQSQGNVRVARNIKIVATIAVVVFVAALVSVVAGNKGRLMRSDAEKNGMFGGNAQISGSPMGGIAVAPDQMMYPEAKNLMVSDSAGIGGGAVPVSDGADVSTDAKVMKTADMTLKVESTEKAVDDFRGIAGRLGGSILNSSLSDVTTSVPNGEKSGMVAMNVPADRFEEALRDIRSVARVVVYESTSGQDVSREYADLQARLKNKQIEEESIAAILNRDTNKIDDVLRVTIELSRVRGEIEQLQAQVKYMDSRTDMSTITVSFTEDARVGGTTSVWRPGQDAKDAVNALIKAGQRMVSFLISFVIAVLPILIVTLVIFGAVVYAVVKKLHRWLSGFFS